MIVQKEELIKTKFGLIPNDWRIKRLKELGSSIIGLTYSPKDVVDKNEGILVLRSSNIQNGRLSFKDNVYVDMEIKDKLYVKKGDLLVCARNGSKQLIGKNAYIDKDYNYSFGAFMSVFRSDYNEYIYQLFQTDMYKKQIQANLGATINQITTKDINSFQFPFPKNIKEQQKIASILSTWDKAIELKEKLIEQKKEQKKGLMQKLLTGEVRLPGFEGEWREVNLAKVSKRIKGKAVEYLENGKFPAIDMDYLESGLFKNFSNDATVFAKKNDVLLLWDGSRAGMAFTGVEGALGSTFVKLECKSIHNIFLQKHLEMNERKIQRLREGSGIPHVPKDFLNFYKIKMPSMDEQKAISNVLNNMDKNLEFLQKEIVYLKQQKQGLMQQLLTGKIRVKV